MQATQHAVPTPIDTGFRATLYDPMVVSPCKTCSRLALRIPRDVCITNPDCPLYQPPQEISCFSKGEISYDDMPTEKECPICGKFFKKPSRLAWALWPKKKTCSVRCAAILASNNKKKNVCQFQGCKEKTKGRCCGKHSQLVNQRRRYGWPEERLLEPINVKGSKK